MNFYISKFRYKLAFACLSGIFILLISGKILHMSFYVIFRDYGTAFAILLIMSFLLWYPAFRYVRSDAKEIWERWGSLGRQKEREEFENFQFDRVYKNTRYGLTKEPGKGYRTMTTLENCNCPEFRKNHTPCKHMYKLADELGLYK